MANTIVKLEDNGDITLRNGSIGYTLSPDNLFNAAHNFLNGRDEIRSNNLTDLHDYIVDKLGARCYELTIEWRESGDDGQDDYPYNLSLDLIAYVKGGKIEKNLSDIDWSKVDLKSLIEEIKI